MIAYLFQYCSLLWYVSIFIVVCYVAPLSWFRIIHLENNVYKVKVYYYMYLLKESLKKCKP